METVLDVETDFDIWMAEVGFLTEYYTGVVLEDGLDWASRDCFDDGLSPEEGYEAWLEAQE